MDCDGVLTDGRLYFSSHGEEMKVFDVRDGQGIVSWHRAGFKSGIISGRGASEIINKRAEELGIEFVRTSSKDKMKELSEIVNTLGLSLDEVAFVGDDLGDIEVMQNVGLAVAVADAVEDTKRVAAYVTKANGGRGAVREIIDMLLARRLK
jgi:YrbI family 3-deoxy-D-manno-octulosonate 8-phosphate phosphatase